jgi:hypothetical protein
MALMDLNTQATTGAANLLLTNALWLLVLGRGTATWSVDCYIKNRSWASSQLVPAWVRYVAIFQIMLCYFMTGLQKVSVHWMPVGEWSALYYILQQPSWQRFDLSWVAYFYPITQIATAAIWFWEILTPLWAWALVRAANKHLSIHRLADKIRWCFFLMGIAFHGGIYLFMDIGIFPLVSLAYYPCLLLVDDFVMFSTWVDPLLARCKRNAVNAN